ncbi:MAG TPA: exodeoxyribonuclease VII small subunit [Candidatus Polarisedimenticolia bacterium]|jgi:exodeoxyribonuclease VII small subunit|nr:exodeoxyribonuclease VII small subunit [Candidatus Polarisedimenticolia bacterium]
MMKKGPKEPRFEEALAGLERIVRDLEGGDLPLDDALKLFEEGVRLSRFCSTKLDEAEKRIEILMKGADGAWTPEPFAPGGADLDEPAGGGEEE